MCVRMLVSYVLVFVQFFPLPHSIRVTMEAVLESWLTLREDSICCEPESHFKDVREKLSSLCACTNIHDRVVAVAFRARVALVRNITLLLSAFLFALTVRFCLCCIISSEKLNSFWSEVRVIYSDTFRFQLAREEKRNLHNCCCWIQKSPDHTVHRCSQ